MLSNSLLVISAVITFLSYIVTYRLFFHPLCTVPGPCLARLTKLWLIWHARRGKNHILMPALHKRYGPIVRITPDQVLVCDGDAIRIAYGAATKFTKGSWYRKYICSRCV